MVTTCLERVSMMGSERGRKDWCLGAVKSVAGLERCVCRADEGKQLIMLWTDGYCGLYRERGMRSHWKHLSRRMGKLF